MIDGDETIVLDYQHHFSRIEGSGKITINAMNAYGTHCGRNMFYGASGIDFGMYERTGDLVAIDSDDIVLKIPEESGNDLLFAGESTVGLVGCIIDVNENGHQDDGDWYACQKYLVVGDDQTINFDY